MAAREQLFAQPEFLAPVHSLGPLAAARVGLTGHRGVLGSLLSERLQRGGTAVSHFPGDVTDARALLDWVEKARPELLFHLAAVVPVDVVEADPARAYEVNAASPLSLVAAVHRAAPGAWVFLASSSHVYRPLPAAAARALAEEDPVEPATFYGQSKLAAERLVQPLLPRLSLRCAIGRIFSFSHPRQRPPYLVPALRAALERLPESEPLEVRAASSVRDILDAETVVDAMLALALRRAEGVVNIGSGLGLTVADIARSVARRAGRAVELRPVADDSPNALVADVRRLRELLRAPFAP